MSELPKGADAALAPLRAALRAAAEQQADAIAADAERDAAAAIADAHRQADALLVAARADGEAAGRRVAAARSARTRRTARETVLRAQAEADAATDAAVAEAVASLRGGKGYAALERRLRAEARALLGPAAKIETAPEGGIVASDGSRRIDASLPALAAEASDWLRRGPS
ncbi:hypothetical protein [Gryllotalpicola sp.]|uniref:hypothetical protein n=1 Tax=Gryllotalpicola sp. TaxID=1932787 RepID=UPI00261181F5|nr:hypothetical protein [Gryllotalpicola sp.]